MIICGAGVIGVSIALELRDRGAEVLLLDASEPGREASHASAGMLSACDPETPPALRAMANASAKLYPEFLASLQPFSAADPDYREGTLLVRDSHDAAHTAKELGASPLPAEHVAQMEPALSLAERSAFLLDDASVDPRELMRALLDAAKARGIHLAHGSPVTKIEVEGGCVTAAHTARARYCAATVINCAGAWSGQFSPLPLPTRPVKGHMLDVIAPPHLIRHVLRATDVYIVPRTGGRILIGSTTEEKGFDKRVDTAVIQRLYQAAANLVPALGETRLHHAWAGLRPGTPDGLPILGATSLRGYFVATGHYRNGILLAPITAKIVGALVHGEDPGFDLNAFSAVRFGGAR